MIPRRRTKNNEPATQAELSQTGEPSTSAAKARRRRSEEKVNTEDSSTIPTTNALFIAGNKKAEILIVCDPPTMEEWREGKVMKPTYRSRILRELTNAGIEHSNIAVIAAAPPFPASVGTSQAKIGAFLKEYKAEFDEKVSSLPNTQLIVTFGSHAARQVHGRAVKITKSRGQVANIERFGCPSFASYGVGYILARPENEAIFNADMSTLARIYRSGYNIEEACSRAENIDYRWVCDISDVLRGEYKTTAYDIEGVGLDVLEPNYRILCAQITPKAGVSYLLPVDREYYERSREDHVQRVALLRKRDQQGEQLSDSELAIMEFDPPLFTEDDFARVKEQLLEYLMRDDLKKVGHNLKFDVHAAYSAYGVELKGWAHDTMQMSFAVDDNMQSRSLAECTRRWVPALAGYSDVFDSQVDKSRMDLVPLYEMTLYGGGDTDACFRLAKELYVEMMKDKRNKRCYDLVQMPALNMFVRMERNGISLDKNALRDFREVLEETKDRYYRELIAMVPPKIKREFLENCKDKKKSAEEALSFSRSEFLIAVLFRSKKEGGRGLRPRVFTDSTKELDPEDRVPSTSKKLHLPYFLLDEFVALYVKYSEVTKMLSTYVGDESKGTGMWQHIKHDDRLHPSFGLSGTVTGRVHCVHASTLIPTRDRGTVRIDEMTTNDYVWTHKGRWRRVTEVIQKQEDTMYDVEFSNGNVLRCTSGHKLLTRDGKWTTVEDVCFKKTSSQQGTISESCGVIRKHTDDLSTDCESSGSDSSDSRRNVAARSTEGEIQETESNQVLQFKDGGEEPTLREETHQLSGAMSRSQGLSNGSGGWEEVFCTSNRNGKINRDSRIETTSKLGGSSHRRESNEQSHRQLGISQCDCTPCDSYEIQEIEGGSRIERIIPRGSYKVYDITVEEDHSYEAAGVFNHNSNSPNGQNFPKRSELAKPFRKALRAGEGNILVSVDLSQAEIRVAACQANERRMIRLYNEGTDIHKATAALTMGISIDEFSRLEPSVQKNKRQGAKGVNFGLLYGMWWKSFRTYAKTEYGLDFTEKEAQDLHAAYFRGYKDLTKWHDRTKAFVHANGYVRALHGALRRLPSIYSNDPGLVKQAERNAINSPIQRFGSDLGIIAMTRFDRDCPKDDASPCLFIHDDNTIEVFGNGLIGDELIEKGKLFASYMKYYMENPPLESMFGITLPLPIVADAEVGYSLGEMNELADLQAVCPPWYNAE